MYHKLLLLFLTFAISLQGQNTTIKDTDIDDVLVDISTISNEVFFDIKYATADNFLKEPIYDCPSCYLQPEVANAVYLANQYFCEMGFYLKFYDCYRPIDIQKKMWQAFPNPKYVANPYTQGSVHSRAAAIDVTLVDEQGCELDMGTGYDYFGREAHIDNELVSEKVLENRSLLQEGLKNFGFSTIRTEWWHFNYRKNYLFAPLNTPFNCN